MDIASLFLNLWGLFWAILFFGGSIFVHELGHFLMAKKRGLQVPRFSIGFGPKLFSWEHNGTEYRLAWLPLGGYVSLPQMGGVPILEGETEQANGTLSFTDKFLVAIMGAVFNLIFAFILACVLWIFGLKTLKQDQQCVVGYVLPQYEGVATPAAKIGLKPGDEILSVDGIPVTTFSDIEKRIMLGSGHDATDHPQATLVYRRNGKVFKETLDLMRIRTNDATGDTVRFSGIAAPQQTLIVAGFEAGGTAERCGLRKGDQLLQVDQIPLYSLIDLRQYLNKKKPREVDFLVERDGQRLHITCETKAEPSTREWFRYGNPKEAFVEFYATDQGVCVLQSKGTAFVAFSPGTLIKACSSVRVENLKALADFLKEHAQQPLILEIENNGHTQLVNLPAMSDPVDWHAAETVQRVGIVFEQPTQYVHDHPGKQLKQAFGSTFETLSALVNPHSDVKVKHLMGPPGIMRTLHRFSIDDFRRLLWFIVILNVNLAILNLLPIPVLDGGHILFALIEKLKGRPLSPSVVLWIQSTFVWLFVGFISYILFFDVRRWQGDRQMEAKQQRLEKLTLPVHIR